MTANSQASIFSFFFLLLRILPTGSTINFTLLLVLY